MCEAASLQGNIQVKTALRIRRSICIIHKETHQTHGIDFSFFKALIWKHTKMGWYKKITRWNHCFWELSNIFIFAKNFHIRIQSSKCNIKLVVRLQNLGNIGGCRNIAWQRSWFLIPGRLVGALGMLGHPWSVRRPLTCGRALYNAREIHSRIQLWRKQKWPEKLRR